MEKREMNIPRQWGKRVMGKNSPYKDISGRYAKRKSVYPEGNRKSDLERVLRNMSTEAKLSLLQPELAKAKQEGSERKELQSLLGPALGDDMDSLPDDPWFGKSPEEKYADVIQEEHGQYEDLGSGLPGMSVDGTRQLSGRLGFVSEDEGEDKLLNKLARGKYEAGKIDETPEIAFGAGNSLDWGKDWEGEEESTLDRIGRENRRRADLAESHASYGSRHQDPDAGGFAWMKGLFASDEDSAPDKKSKGLSPMQKYGAKLITDIFGEKEGAPQQSIGASPLTPGRTFDMSYLKSRPKKERYRNMGLLGRA